jgi:hypothetical protein
VFSWPRRNPFRPCWSSLRCRTIPVCWRKDYIIRKIHKCWFCKTTNH